VPYYIATCVTCPALPQFSMASFRGNVTERKTCFYFLYNLRLKQGRALTQALSCRPTTTEERVPFQASAGEICGGQSSIGTGFSPSTSVVPRQFQSTNIQYSSIRLSSFLAIHTIQPTKRTIFFLRYLYSNITSKIWR
jgi:hypothetical protein